MDVGSRGERSKSGVGSRASWLSNLENEIRHRVGWVDELVSPFARGKAKAAAKTPVHLVTADTLLFSAAGRKSA